MRLCLAAPTITSLVDTSPADITSKDAKLLGSMKLDGEQEHLPNEKRSPFVTSGILALALQRALRVVSMPMNSIASVSLSLPRYSTLKTGARLARIEEVADLICQTPSLLRAVEWEYREGPISPLVIVHKRKEPRFISKV